ncbi:MAG: ABC transporter ATP-binding protein [Clostridia bacterium]|nr:ABC transporter ATP-binding protein [Clostridia bacterium]
MQINVQNLSYAASGSEILRDISASFGPGLTALLGPNGAGKTTFLRLLSGFLTPMAGRILLDGEDLHSIPVKQRAQQIAIVPQHERFDYDFSVMDIVLMGRIPWKRTLESDTAEDRQIAREALSEAGIEELAERSVLTLSGGERQRVSIARAFCQRTPALLLDEPVSALDIRHQVGILSAVRRYVRERSLLGIIVLHDLNLAAWYAGRLILMKRGQIVTEGPAEQVLEQSILEDVYETDVRILRDGEEMYVLPKLVRGAE